MTRTYAYEAEIVRWIDGDSVWLNVDLGFRTHTITNFRLTGVDTPERGKPGHDEAVTAVNAWAPTGTEVSILTFKDPDKYGRWLAEVTPAGGPSVNSRLVTNKLAVPYFGGKK